MMFEMTTFVTEAFGTTTSGTEAFEMTTFVTEAFGTTTSGTEAFETTTFGTTAFGTTFETEAFGTTFETEAFGTTTFVATIFETKTFGTKTCRYTRVNGEIRRRSASGEAFEPQRETSSLAERRNNDFSVLLRLSNLRTRSFPW
ncbi:hypothetical protein [Pendulispora albinea]|uniref:Uncharacterized protein n=1 Tax=Pendulispora albinea TaxID=2741071 RepID=A0ABZ2LLC6_9BACT